MATQETSSATRPRAGTVRELQDVAHAQSDRLHDLRAMLTAMKSMGREASEGNLTDSKAIGVDFGRLAELAREIVDEIQEELAPHI